MVERGDIDAVWKMAKVLGMDDLMPVARSQERSPSNLPDNVVAFPKKNVDAKKSPRRGQCIDLGAKDVFLGKEDFSPKRPHI